MLLRIVVGWRGGDGEAVERLPHGQRAVDLPGEVRPRRRRVAQLPHRRRPRHHRLRLLLLLHMMSRGSDVRRAQDRLEGRPGPFLLQHADRLGAFAILEVGKSGWSVTLGMLGKFGKLNRVPN